MTEYAYETNRLGRDGLVQFIVTDGTYLCMEMLEDDLAALFASASNSVGTSGADLSVANFVEAIAKLDTAKARGRKVCVLDDQQAVDLRLAVAASNSTIFANSMTSQTVLNSRSDAYLGELFGVPIWLTNLTDTANGGADVVGCIMIEGASAPENAPIGVALLWEPRVRTLYLPEQIGEQVAITMAYGAGEISDFNYVKLVTDA